MNAIPRQPVHDPFTAWSDPLYQVTAREFWDMERSRLDTIRRERFEVLLNSVRRECPEYERWLVKPKDLDLSEHLFVYFQPPGLPPFVFYFVFLTGFRNYERRDFHHQGFPYYCAVPTYRSHPAIESPFDFEKLMMMRNPKDDWFFVRGKEDEYLLGALLEVKEQLLDLGVNMDAIS